MLNLLLWIGIIVVAFWLLGVIFNILGGIIHILLIVAVIMFVIYAIKKSRSNR
jgi:4-hydroxybenzoate polyprenyltransferase